VERVESGEWRVESEKHQSEFFSLSTLHSPLSTPKGVFL